MTYTPLVVERRGKYPNQQIDQEQGHQGRNKKKPDGKGDQGRHEGLFHGENLKICIPVDDGFKIFRQK